MTRRWSPIFRCASRSWRSDWRQASRRSHIRRDDPEGTSRREQSTWPEPSDSRMVPQFSSGVSDAQTVGWPPLGSSSKTIPSISFERKYGARWMRSDFCRNELRCRCSIHLQSRPAQGSHADRDAIGRVDLRGVGPARRRDRGYSVCPTRLEGQRLQGRVNALWLWKHPHPSLAVDKHPTARSLRKSVIALPVHQELTSASLRQIAGGVQAALG